MPNGLHNSLVDNWFHDAKGRTARQALSGSSLTTVTQYDAVERVKLIYQATGSFSATAPAEVGSAVVASTTRPRFDDATGNGPLGTPASTGDPKARVSYSAPDPHRSAQPDRFSRQGKALLPLKTVQSAAPPDGVAPPTAWTIGVQAFPRSSFRFQTKNFVCFFCLDTNEEVFFSVPLFSKAKGLQVLL